MKIILNKLKKQSALIFPYKEMHEVTITDGFNFCKVRKKTKVTCPKLLKETNNLFETKNNVRFNAIILAGQGWQFMF